MGVLRITSSSQLEALVGSWNELAGDVPFRRWEWLGSWWRQYGAAHELYVLAVHDEHHQLLALAPWYLEFNVARGRVVKFLGSNEACTDHLSILVRPGCESRALSELANWLTAPPAAAGPDPQANQYDLLELTGVDLGDAAVMQLAEKLEARGNTIERRTGPNCWVIELPASWDEYTKRLSKNHRKEFRRTQERYVDTGRTSFQVAADRASFEYGFNLLVQLHTKRWRSLGEPGCFADPRFTNFLREAAWRMFEKDLLRLCWITVDGRPGVAEIHFAAGRRLFAYQAGTDPEMLEFSPGRILHYYALRAAIEAGWQSVDFLRGDERYKHDLRAESRPSMELRCVPRGTLAQVRFGLWQTGLAVKGWIKEGLSLVGLR